MRRFVTRLAVASFIVWNLVACGGTESPLTAAQADILGTWSLATVSDKPLPALVLTTATGKVELVSDMFAFSVNGVYVESAVVRTTTNGVAGDTTYNDNGNYALNRSSVALLKSSIDGTTQSANLAGGVLTISASNGVFVYKR